MSCSIWEKGAQGIEKKSNKEGTQATATHSVIFLEHVWAKIFQKVCEICQEASKPILLHERACQVWQCWTQCDRMWQMHSLLSLFSRYYLPGPHKYDGPKFEKWVKLLNISLVIAVPSSCYIPLSALSSSFCPALLLVWCFSTPDGGNEYALSFEPTSKMVESVLLVMSPSLNQPCLLIWEDIVGPFSGPPFKS